MQCADGEKSNKNKEKGITAEERVKLAEKLDKELDDFINKLPKKGYEDGWPEERWEEEMDKHPFFMRDAPEPGAELHPLYEGLQKLKYDPEENEPYELALAYKDDGNFNFKHKNYRMAVISYSEGIKVKCGNNKIEANLFNNRAAAHYFLKNYRSAFQDCQMALKLEPSYEKAMKRAAYCCYHLQRFNEAIDYCKEILLDNKRNVSEICELLKKSTNAKKIAERNARKNQLALKKRTREEEILIEELMERGIRFLEGDGGDIDLVNLEPQFPQLIHNRVHLNETNNLIWPTIFLYPEYGIMDYIQEFDENDLLIEQLESVFCIIAEWDKKRAYFASNLNVYFENDEKKLVNIDPKYSLKEILTTKGYIVKGGTPAFIIFVRNSPTEEKFLTSS